MGRRDEYFNKLVRINGDKLNWLRKQSKKEKKSMAMILDLILEGLIK